MTACLYSAMRNEGPDVVEWVAWHRLIGFDRIVVWTNDCTDKSDELLDALQNLGWVEHHRHHPAAGASVQGQVAEHALRCQTIASAEWLMWLDADEFLVVKQKDGRLSDLLSVLSDADGMAINWRLFGDSGYDHSPPAPVTESFVQASQLRFRLNRSVKTIHRMDKRVKELFIHRPVWHRDALPAIRLLAGDGRPLPESFVYGIKDNGNPQEMVEKGRQSWKIAQINHYAVKALERVAAKRLRGDGLYANWSDRFDFRYLKRFNKNDETDTTAHRHLPELKAMIAQALSDATVASAYRACEQAFSAMLADLGQQTQFLAKDRYGLSAG
ncbi:glycosyltransferase family 2 protein [Paragemmobacter ruber]|uniref:Glycosyltransferase family 92 protein n=1 Tax=Paragemmobacter ruber TaxID=1985673 RepID=A0ABW9Y8T2_9RHOB|nr:glycosyltransferase family 2 protein [Rhodobacter ruber]NBE08933.1 glycosyltransferase family 92 protein [Rhodobacter ruber]